jgi:Asp-tRNA(Asn)/Glu-tRNA(Gln) amidotransferase B subunit
MRIKSDEVDYHYFPEPNIIAVDISSLIVGTSTPKLPTHIKDELLALSIPNDIVDQLINNIDAYKAFV